MKNINFFLVSLLFIIISLPITAKAETPQNAYNNYATPRYAALKSIGAGLKISDKNATCSGSSKVDTGYSVSIAMVLYRQSGSSWVNVTSWSGSGTGLEGISLEKKYSVSSGVYKVVVTASVYKNGTLIETQTKTSDFISC